MPSKCQALDGNGKRCRRDATHSLKYYGESEMYFYASGSVCRVGCAWNYANSTPDSAAARC
jgi:hypothetical protein